MGASGTFRVLSSEMTPAAAAVAAAMAALLLWVSWSATWLWWAPRRLERSLRAQGLLGTRYCFPSGDLKENARLIREALIKPLPLSHCIIPRVSPFLHRVINQCGKFCITWIGPIPRVTIMNPDLVREILSTKFGHFEKPKINPLGKLLVTGLVSYEGEKWARHRRIINPAFHIEKLRRMQSAFSSCCRELIERWEKLIDHDGTCELDVWPEFQNLSSDVISKTAFGNSHEEGRRIFQLQTEQSQLLILSSQNVYIPGFRFLPTPVNRRRNQINREVRSLLRGMIEKREKAIKSGEKNIDDLLGLLIETNLKQSEEHGNYKKGGMTTEDIIEECKLFYFAGQETTSVLLNWTMVLLSIYPSWQERAREEVRQVFGENAPDFDGLSRLKIVTMILHEVLRLYPPIILLGRMTYKTMELGGITYPKGVILSLPVIFIHHDPEIWGEDAHEFKPERFANGIWKATKNNQMAFFPFGWGPRICVGQNFAMSEAKMCLSLILQRFKFELSPSYIHSPYTVITLQPQHGTQVVLRRIE
ncbi:cytochrome P450 72A15 [Dendrobium catenatum]|uniref:Secologanin synthase n=1 Tax=Dendrobium catenatum TaxID=906689 RepID=A0A2I0WQG7_9ASPA|nr:cytochrome P450 72A15 [Dendrobium catenatum]PKU77886.1 Secologanin synthase [Dendrobium catenatum]